MLTVRESLRRARRMFTPNHRSLPIVAAAAAALTGLSSSQAQIVSVEPNQSKATATPATLAPGQFVTGSSIGALDYFRIKTAPAAPGIYRNDLVVAGQPGLGAAQIRCRTQSAGVAFEVDNVFQSSTFGIGADRTVRWYGFGKQEEVIVSLNGGDPYTATLVSTPITPTPINAPIASGDVTIRLSSGPGNSVSNTDLFIYDANFDYVTEGSNDNKDGNFSRITRSLAPGTYYLAIEDSNLANDQTAPRDDNATSGNILDLPNALARSGFNTTPRNFTLSISSPGRPEFSNVYSSMTGFAEINWFTFIVEPPGACVPGASATLLSSAAAPAASLRVPVSVSGTTAIIGNPLDDGSSLSDSGSASVFVRSGTQWVEQAKLTNAAIANGDQAGTSVAISGDIAVLGAPLAASQAGRAFVFVRSAGFWTFQTTLSAPDSAVGFGFGTSLAIEGDTIVVGAPVATEASISSGAAYVFTRTGTAWNFAGKLVPSAAVAGDAFGTAVALSGSTIVAGATGRDLPGVANAGAAFVFSRSGGIWTQVAELVASDTTGAPDASEQFGSTVAIRDDVIVVGSPRNDVAPLTNNGSAYVFVRSGLAWTEEARLGALDATTNDAFGTQVAIEQDTILIGAPFDTIGNQTNAGSSYLFRRSGGVWSQASKFTAPQPQGLYNFGTSLAISGSLIAVGEFRGGGIVPYNGASQALIFDASAPAIDGSCDTCYAGAIATQIASTRQDSSIGDVNIAEGSELYSMHARIINNTLFLSLPGNLSSTSGKLELFFDTQPGGQNTLSPFNPPVAYGALTQMAGLTFDADFAPDYYLTVAGGYIPALRQVDFASIPTGGGGASSFLGYLDPWLTGTLTGGTNPHNVQVAIDNRNVVGVSVLTTTGSSIKNQFNASTPTTGLELSIPLAAIGSPTCAVRVLAFINGDNHASVSNQFLPHIGPVAPLGAPSSINLAAIPGVQHATVGTFPSITRQPVGLAVCELTPAVFRIEALNAATFQWRKNAVPLIDGGSVAGSATPTLTLASASLADAGAYDCVVTSSCGVSQASAPATLVVDQAYTGAAPQLVVAPSANTNDLFGIGNGSATPLSGDTLAIGAGFMTTGAGVAAGTVQVYTRFANTWIPQQTIHSPDAAPNDRFGGSWALSGDTLVIGADGDDAAAGVDSGAVYVFVRSGSTWTLQQKLAPGAAAAGDRFGYAVAISGERIVVGAPFNDVNVVDEGSVYVFLRTGSVWTQEGGTIVQSGIGTSGDQLGVMVAISGDTIAVGAPTWDSSLISTNTGSVFVYTRSGSTWPQLQRLQAFNFSGEQFGGSIALDGNTLLVGSPQRDNPLSNSGQVHVYFRSSTTFALSQTINPEIPASSNRFGFNVALSGDTALITSPFTDTVAGADAGVTHVYIRRLNQWIPHSTLSAPDGAPSDNFGVIVATDGFRAIATAPNDDIGVAGATVNAGSAWSFFLQQPVENVSVAPGATGVFSLSSPPPGPANAGVRWRRAGVLLNDGPTGSGSTISGAFTSSLSISNVSAADVNTYDCIISSGCGTLLSRPASLTLTSPPPIVAFPPQAFACRSAELVISAGDIGATLPELAWQFRIPDSAPETWTHLHPGAFSAGAVSGTAMFSQDMRTLVLGSNWTANAPSTLQFRCVSNTAGPMASAVSSVTFCPADADCSQIVDVQDVFHYLNAWFNSEPAADFDADSVLTAGDIFAFLNAWFAGC